MFTHAKYIIVQQGGLELPIVFSDLLKHSDIAREHKVVAAGFVTFGVTIDPNDHGYEPQQVIEVSTYGESSSLGGIKSRGVEDDNVILRMIGAE